MFQRFKKIGSVILSASVPGNKSRQTNFPINEHMLPALNAPQKQLFIVGIVIALLGLFLLPLLSGSNHSCPVLREQDLEKGTGAHAVPAFARKYNVDCTYCHTAWPQLNRTGYIFRRLGYRMPWEVPTVPRTPSATAPPEALPSPTPVALPPAIISGLRQGVGAAAKPPSPENITAGQKVFTQMQCFTCHANGDNVINQSKPIKGMSFLNKYPEDAAIAQLIRRGVPGTAMPAYGKERLSDAQLVTLIAYVRSLTPPQ